MTKLLLFCTLAAMTLAAAETLYAADVPCPLLNATLRGTYMVHGEGYIVVNTFSASINGEIQRGSIISGPYTVNPDCTMTSSGNGGNYDFVVMPDGSSLSWIETDPGTVFHGSAVRFKYDRDNHE
jgi:hypothetical protein